MSQSRRLESKTQASAGLGGPEALSLAGLLDGLLSFCPHMAVSRGANLLSGLPDSPGLTRPEPTLPTLF